MTTKLSIAGRRALQLVMLFAATSAIGATVYCIEPTPGPAECCTLSVESAGSEPSYGWAVVKGPGYVDPLFTTYNWSLFHCPETADGMADIEVHVFGYGLWGTGHASCSNQT